jgi:hypothetical protein
MAIYPGEIHFFRRAYVLRDAWRRSEDFFDKYLLDPNAVKSSETTSPPLSGDEPGPAQAAVVANQ